MGFFLRSVINYEVVTYPFTDIFFEVNLKKLGIV